MRQSGLSAIDITDCSDSQKLIGNFSVSDLRSIQSEHFGSLALPVGEFLALEHGLEFWDIADHEQVKVSQIAPILLTLAQIGLLREKSNLSAMAL